MKSGFTAFVLSIREYINGVHCSYRLQTYPLWRPFIKYPCTRPLCVDGRILIYVEDKTGEINGSLPPCVWCAMLIKTKINIFDFVVYAW